MMIWNCCFNRSPGLVRGQFVAALAILIPLAATPAGGATPAIPITAPSGFEVVRAAGPPLVERPLFATFDDHGQLFVLDSGGVNGDDRAERPPDVIRRLTDTDGDGVFDTSHLFADRIVFGSGLLWYDGAVYVTSPPSLWRLRDRNGDGTADERTELVTGFAFNQSCSDDAHGACLGLDGRIYFLPGRFPHEIRAPGGPLLRKGIGPWLMRCRADGSEIEFVSGCVGNPVEVDFLPNGAMFAQGTYWAKPSRGDGLRDAVVHLVEGGEYEVRDRDYTDRVRTGELLPALVPMSATAPSGCTIYRSGQFGADYQDNLFGAYFNTARIMRYRLQPAGATYSTAAEDFLVGLHADVHFTDVTEDADGSLLAVDTGGWFRRCCPTSQLAKPEILGAIYRVRRATAQTLDDPRGLRMDWQAESVEHLAALLDDPRFAVRERATEELRLRSSEGIPALDRLLTDSTSPRQRLAAVWTLTRIDAPMARTAIRRALDDDDATVRQAAVVSVALYRDAAAIAELLPMLHDDPSLAVRSEVANALGRIGDRSAIRPLLAALATETDQSAESHVFFNHALVLALIRIGEPAETRQGLSDNDVRVQRGALIALDQMPTESLRREDLLSAIDSEDPALRRAALQSLTRHGQWSDAAVSLMNKWLGERSADASFQVELSAIIHAFCSSVEVQQTIARHLEYAASMSDESISALLDALAGCGLTDAPAEWQIGVGRLVLHPNETVSLAGLRAVESLKLQGALAAAQQRAGDSTQPPALRLAAIRACSVLQGQLMDEQFGLLTSELAAEIPLPRRLAALEVLAGARLANPQLARLIPFVSSAGPVELPPLLRAFSGGSDEQVGVTLVEALAATTAEVSDEQLRTTLANYPATVRDRAQPIAAQFAANAARQAERLNELDAQLTRLHGSSTQGRELFYSRANCHLCHRVQGQGGTVGPDLSTIGAIRSQRDLLEAVLAPSASFARGYEPVTVILQDGRTINGLVGRETPEVLIVHGVQESKPIEIPLQRDQIEELHLGRVSLMPEGLEQQLSPQELSDLLTYLTGLRQESPR